MEFLVLGPLDVMHGDVSIEIAGSKRKALLVLLILRANEVVRTELLIDELWGEQPPRNAAAALQSHVSRLRKALGSEVVARREWGYILRTPPESIDLSRFERLLVEADPLPARERAAKLAEALDLWRGPPLADLMLEPGLQQEIARLDELRLSTIERRIDADLEAGRSSELVGELERLIANYPVREHLRWQLILSLYRAGRQAEALEVYRETRRMLADELGLEPSPALRELERAILRQDPLLAGSGHEPPSADPLPERSVGRKRGTSAALIALLLLGSGAATAYALSRGDQSRSAQTKAAGAVTVTNVHAAKSASPATTAPRRHARHPNVRHAPPPVTATQPSADSTPKVVTETTSTTTAPPTSKTTSTSTSTTTQTTTTSTTTTPSRTWRTLSDDFSESTPNDILWTTWAEGDGATYTLANGRLEFTLPASARPGGRYNMVGPSLGTRCRFGGDFDAQVDFELLEWPAGAGVHMQLSSWVFPNVNSSAGRQINHLGDQYIGNVNQSFTTVPTRDAKGTIRLTRSRGVESAYYRSNGSWVLIQSGTVRGQAQVGIQLFAMADEWSRSEVKVAFDNFRVSAPSLTCP